MFRYLEKYTGTYRVLGYLDVNTNDFPRTDNGDIDPSYEDLYIPCSRGKSVIKHTYEKDILVICFYGKNATAKNVYKELKDKYKKIYLKYEDCGEDGLIYFKADDIKKIATIVRPKTSGASIKWNSNKNLPKVSYDIPKEDNDKLVTITKDLSRPQKMRFGKTVSSLFLTSKNLKEEQKQSRLTPKQFIHSKGLWEEYIKLAKKEVKNVN